MKIIIKSDSELRKYLTRYDVGLLQSVQHIHKIAGYRCYINLVRQGVTIFKPFKEQLFLEIILHDDKFYLKWDYMPDVYIKVIGNFGFSLSRVSNGYISRPRNFSEHIENKLIETLLIDCGDYMAYKYGLK